MKQRMRDTPFKRIQLRRARDADIPDCYSQPNLNSEIAWPKQFLWGDIWEEHQKVFIHSSFFHFLNSTFHVYRLFLCLQVSKKVADLILEKQPAYVKVSLQCRLKTTLNNVLCIPAADV